MQRNIPAEIFRAWGQRRKALLLIIFPSPFVLLFALCIYKILLLERPNKDLLKNAHKEGFPAHKRMD
jgi:hypothetical protein